MKKVLLFILLAIITIGSIYIYYFYYNEYDAGNREGKLYYFSKSKGNVIKTSEGILLQPGLRSGNMGGLNTNEFHFSVEDKGIADSLEKCVGKIVVVHYTQYRKSLFWRGENNNNDNKDKGQFIVDKIINVTEESNNNSNTYY